jgi:formylglycine-generating enzyme required for sulfatase activity
LEPFWIDVYEVSNGQYGLSGWASGDDLPRETVNWFDALGHCTRRGARLPTEAEWEYAARGPDALIFPWGNEFDATLVNYCDVNCPHEQRDNDNDDGHATLAPVGSYPDGASWVGALDVSGNVWEWTSTMYAPYPYDATDGREADGCRTQWGDDRSNGQEWGVCQGQTTRVLRGASWNYPHRNLLRAADRSWYNPDMWEVFYLGFRCARSFSP